MTHNFNDTTIRTNGTLLGIITTVSATHTRKLFCDEELRGQVGATEPPALSQ